MVLVSGNLEIATDDGYCSRIFVVTIADIWDIHLDILICHNLSICVGVRGCV